MLILQKQKRKTMKKQNLKNLALRKKSISKLDNLALKGQRGTADSDFICRTLDTLGPGCATGQFECPTPISYCGC